MLTAERVASILKEHHPYGWDEVPEYEDEGRIIFEAIETAGFLTTDGIENVVSSTLFQWGNLSWQWGDHEPIARAISDAMNEVH